MTVTPDVDYVTITAVVGAMVGDTDNDPDKNPDWATATAGTVTFTPTVSTVHVTDTTSGQTVAMLPFPITCTIDAQGRLTYNGDTQVTLLDLGSDKVNPTTDRTKTAYTVSFSGVKMGDATLKIESFGINPSPADDTDSDGLVNLWDLQPLKPSSGGAIVRGMGLPPVTSATTGDVATYDGTGIVWEAPTGGGGSSSVSSDDITDATTVGKNVLTAADAAAARTAIGAGTSSFSGSYDDLTNKPTSTPTAWDDVTGKPSTFPPTIGTTASTALAGDTVIPAAQVQSDWNAASGMGQILHKPTLGTAAAQDVSTFATAAQGTLADAAVPNTRKVNGKALSSDVTLAASDVGAVAQDIATGASAVRDRGYGSTLPTSAQEGDIFRLVTS